MFGKIQKITILFIAIFALVGNGHAAKTSLKAALQAAEHEARAALEVALIKEAKLKEGSAELKEARFRELFAEKLKATEGLSEEGSPKLKAFLAKPSQASLENLLRAEKVELAAETKAIFTGELAKDADDLESIVPTAGGKKTGHMSPTEGEALLKSRMESLSSAQRKLADITAISEALKATTRSAGDSALDEGVAPENIKGVLEFLVRLQAANPDYFKDITKDPAELRNLLTALSNKVDNARSGGFLTEDGLLIEEQLKAEVALLAENKLKGESLKGLATVTAIGDDKKEVFEILNKLKISKDKDVRAAAEQHLQSFDKEGNVRKNKKNLAEDAHEFALKQKIIDEYKLSPEDAAKVVCCSRKCKT
jgi:hypothetical protein